MQTRDVWTMEHLGIILTGVSMVTTASCPNNWFLYENSCYNVFKYRTTFTSAIRRCAGNQGCLLSMKNAEENRFIKGIISSYLDDQFWIGIHFNRTSWYWLDDSTEVTWSRWAGPKRACALMTGTRRWTSERCTHYHQYICKKDALQTTEASLTVKSSSAAGLPLETTYVPSIFETSITALAVEDDELTTKALVVTEGTDQFVENAHDVTPEVVFIDRKKNPGRTYIDNRPSAIGIGSLGVGVLVCVFLGVVLLDASKLWRDFSMFRHNLADVFRKIKKSKVQKIKIVAE